jgi:HlyD family secretion protein
MSQGTVSERDIENAKAALDVAEARVVVAQKALDLTVAGPRQEEIAEAEARLQGFEAQVGLLREQLVDSRLFAPCDAVVLSRLLEPGEMATPQRPVLTLAITGRKWIRAYVSEPDVGRAPLCAAASVSLDGFPGRRFSGGISFISATAEFTPRSVQTEELRTSLVYEVRIAVDDPRDELRLGMPATVSVDSN